MKLAQNNFAYIDGANLYRGVKNLGWQLDYAGLVKFLLERDKFLGIVSPAVSAKCSVLLKRTGARIAYINDQRSILEVKGYGQKEKAPGRD